MSKKGIKMVKKAAVRKQEMTLRFDLDFTGRPRLDVLHPTLEFWKTTFSKLFITLLKAIFRDI